MSQQGLRQQWFRDQASVSTGSYNENLIAASKALASAPDGRTVNEYEILLLQQQLGSSSTDLLGLRAEMASLVGASNWSGVGALASASTPLAFVGAASSSTATTTLVATLPAHSAGDWLVMWIAYDSGPSAGGSAPAISGWTSLQHERSGTTGFYTGGSLYAKQAGASESAPSITLNAAPDSGCNCWVIAVSGAGSVDASAIHSNVATGNGSFATPGVSNAADAFVIDFAINRRSNEALASAGIDDANEDTVSFGTNATAWYGYRSEVAALGGTGVTVTSPDTTFRPTSTTISLVA